METRVAVRKKIDVKIGTKIDEEFKEKFGLVSGKIFDVTAIDISELGIGFFSKYFLPKGLILDFEIDGTLFGLDKNLKIRGEIRHCQYAKNLKYAGYKCGMKFLNLSEEYKKAIVEFIVMNEKRKVSRIILTKKEEK